MIEVDLPEIIELSDFNGDWPSYINEVYRVFKRDFIIEKCRFRGNQLRMKKHPVMDGKEYTFYHMTHSGNDEKNRQPDLRRCERIAWAKPCIEKCDAWKLKIWEQERKGDKRICIWLELDGEPDYFIVLNVRKGYLIPWTAFVIEYNHQRRKKQKEYEEWLKKQKAPE